MAGSRGLVEEKMLVSCSRNDRACEQAALTLHWARSGTSLHQWNRRATDNEEEESKTTPQKSKGGDQYKETKSVKTPPLKDSEAVSEKPHTRILSVHTFVISEMVRLTQQQGGVYGT